MPGAFLPTTEVAGFLRFYCEERNGAVACGLDSLDPTFGRLDFLLALKDEDSLLSHGASPVISSMGSCC